VIMTSRLKRFPLGQHISPVCECGNLCPCPVSSQAPGVRICGLEHLNLLSPDVINPHPVRVVLPQPRARHLQTKTPLLSIPISSSAFQKYPQHPNTFLSIPISSLASQYHPQHSNIILSIPISSLSSQYIPQHSRNLLSIPISSSAFQYHP
jgi:hypothetical protein